MRFLQSVLNDIKNFTELLSKYKRTFFYFSFFKVA